MSSLIDKVRNKCLWIFYTHAYRILFAFSHVQVGKNFRTNGRIYIKNKGGTLQIGDNVRVNSNHYYNPIGFGNRTTIQLLPFGKVEIGNNVGLSNISIACSKGVKIGHFAILGDGVKVYDTDFHSLNPYIRNSPKDFMQAKKMEIEIGEYSFIGANSILLKGCNIGRYSVIGAGSVVTGIIPDKQIWAGNPAKFIRELRPEELIKIGQEE